MAGRIKSMTHSNVSSGIEPACGAVRQTTAPPRAHIFFLSLSLLYDGT